MSDPAQAPEPSRVGMVVAERFRITDRIGKGGMGSVYRAEQLGLHRDVAVKILRSELVQDSETVARFHREARATSALTHPNTVRVFDFGETPDGSLFLAMELLQGELLTERMRRPGGLGVGEAVDVARQMLRSLAEAHDRGIIHRDLKPDNVFLATVPGHVEPVVKVLDFGIAKIVQGDQTVDPLETQAGTVFGTPRYMSPEQARGRTLDPRSDLYSVGVVLYQLLAGRAPFDDDDAVVVMARHIRERPLRPREVAPARAITPALEAVVIRAVEKDARRRFPSAEAFEAALAACVEEVRALEGGGAPTPVTPPLRARRRRQLQWVGGAFAAGLLAFAFGSALGAFSSDRSAPVRWLGASAAPPRSTPAPDDLVRTPVTTRPEGAWVIAPGGERLGRTPLELERPRGSEAELRIRLPGHGPARVELPMDGLPKLVVLTPLPPRPEPSQVDAQEAPPEPEEAPSRSRRRLLPDEPYERFD